MTATDRLVPWLLTQLDADEQKAKAATSGGPWRIDGMSVRGQTANGTDILVIRHTWPQEAEHIIRHDPARVLRLVAAMRRRLERHRPEVDPVDGQTSCSRCIESGQLGWPCAEIRDDASVFADRDGYDQITAAFGPL